MHNFIKTAIILSTSLVSFSSFAETPLPTVPKANVDESTQNLSSGKCATNVSEYMSLMKNKGYESMFSFKDKERPYILRNFFYNTKNNEMAIISTLYSKDEEITPVSLPIKACLEFLGSDFVWDGKVFKKFVVHQVITQRQNTIEELQKKEKDNE